MNTESATFDVAVVGAGPAGSAAAIALRLGGASVVVIESRASPAWRIGETLPPAARPLLDALGVLAALECDGHLVSYGNRSAWGTDGLVATDFIFDPHGSGWQLDRLRFDARLARRAAEAGASLWYDCQLMTARRVAAGWELVAAGQERRDVRARWIVDATGRRSSVARRVGARRTAIDNLLCVYAVAAATEEYRPPDADTRTLVEAGPDGWWYSALVPGGRRTVAWLTDADLLQGAPWRETDWFRSHVGQTVHLGPLLDRHGYAFIGPTVCTSANSSRAEPWCGSGWMAAGDAAVAFDPLSSQGLFHALYTGMRAGEAVAGALAGDAGAVVRYSGMLGAIWAAYLGDRKKYYRIERRWAGRPFWDRRHENPSRGVAGPDLRERLLSAASHEP